jgi:arabinose-5-phosphate isomerase
MSNKTLIENIMITPDKFTVVTPEVTLITVLERMSEFKIGHVCVVDSQMKLVGVFTDGDFRRLILNIQKPLPALLSDDIIKYASTNPKTTFVDIDFSEVKKQMSENKIWDLPVIDRDQKLVGLIHMSSLLKQDGN